MFKVFHDPGHDLSSPGTQEGGINEQRDVFALASDCSTYANQFKYVESILSRKADERQLYYHDRAKKAKAWGANLVICHHINALNKPAKGLMTFYIPNNPIGKTTAEVIARCAPTDLLRDEKSRCIASDPAPHWTQHAFNVMNNYWTLGLNVLLIEWGFSTDPSDVKILLDPIRRPELCACVMYGITRAISLTHMRSP